MKSLIFDGLELNNQSGGYYLLQPLEGLELSALSVSTYNKSGTDGIRIPSIFNRERRIGVQGVLRATCADDHIVLRKELASKCVPVKDSNGRLEQKVLQITDEDDSEYLLYVQAVGLLNPRTNPENSKYMLDLLASDGTIYGATEKSATVEKSVGGGLTIEFDIPFSFEGGVVGAETVTNAGDLITYPTIIFNGSLTNPRLTNQTNGQFIQLNTTINVGQAITVDMLNKTVMLGTTQSRISTMTSNSNFWGLESGENTLVLTSGSDGDTGDADITFRNGYSGL